MSRVEVLVIEDNPADLNWLESVLEEIGLNCLCWSVSDGEEALDFLLKRNRHAGAPTPDLIFLDAHLPKLDGIEILRNIPHQDSNYVIKPVNTRSIRLCPQVRDFMQASIETAPFAELIPLFRPDR